VSAKPKQSESFIVTGHLKCTSNGHFLEPKMYHPE